MAKKYSKAQLNELVEELKKGRIVAFPTDTVFGLGCTIDDFASLLRIKEIKKRDANKPLPIMCSNLKMIEELAILDSKTKYLIKTIGKGAITYILPKQPNLNPIINNGMENVAIRVPDDDFIISLIQKIEKPLLVTSCNISNEPSLYSVKEVIEKFDLLVDMIVVEDARSSVASTIYDATKHQIIREGNIKLAQIEEILKNVR